MMSLLNALFLSLAAASQWHAPTTVVHSPLEALESHTARGFGGTVLIKVNGGVVFEESRGLRDITRPALGLVGSNDRFLIGSNTKQFVAASILLLEDDGLLSTEDPLSRFMPEYAQAGRVTLSQLMNHTAGIPNYTDLSDIAGLISTPIDESGIFAIFKDLPLDFEPGSEWNYSNSGYFLLGQVIRRVTAKSWFEFVRERILSPVGMNDTGYDPEYFAYEGIQGSDWDERFVLRPTATRFLTWADAAGALHSTASDLSRWNAALHGGKVLSAASYEKMVRPGLANYGLGLIHAHVPPGSIEVIGHSGGLPGFYSKNYFYPNAGAGSQGREVIVLSNNTTGEDGLLEKSLRAIYATGTAEIPQIPAPLALSTPETEEFLGDYTFVDFGSVATFFRSDAGEVFLKISGQGDTGSLVVPVAKDVFYLRFQDIVIEFFRDSASGAVDSMVLTQNGREFRAKRN